MPEQPCAFHPDRVTAVTCSRCDRPICPADHHPAPVGIHCPVCAGKIREGAGVIGRSAYHARARVEATPALRRLTGVSATNVLLGANLAVFVLMLATGRPTAGDVLLRFGALPPTLDRAEWWRLFTAMFVHIGMFHLLFNMWALHLFGRSIEQRFGAARYLALYLGAGLLGSAASLAFTAGGIRAGASGGVFGILGAWVAVFLQHRRHPEARAQLTSLFVLVGINLSFGFTVRGIDNAAHLGGLLAGFLIASGVELSLRKRGPAWTVAGMAGYALAIGIAVALIVPNTLPAT